MPIRWHSNTNSIGQGALKEMGEELDYTTLKWVKDEIQESLNQTCQALETYVENPGDATQMRFCATYLHQIYGTLQMVEIYGGALLAEEMEKVANALLNDEIGQKDDAYDVLMRAILQLPAYLEGLEHGQMDMPVVLLPLLNDLRAARGENLLSENAFFAPDLSVTPPRPQLPPGKTYPDIQAYARKLRPLFQVSLLGWYRERDAGGSLKKLAAVLRELQNASQTDASRRLWWIAGGVIEALIDDGLETGTSVKLLMGHVDQQIKRLIGDGEAVFEHAPPTELLKNCLYYVATAQSSGPRVSGLKQAFHLDQLLPYSGALEEAMDNLKGSSAELMGSVSSVIKEDLLAVKDQLDIFVRSDERDVADLTPLGDSLQRIADTLAMLGLGDLRKVIQQQAGHIDAFVGGGEIPDDKRLMEMASALLYVEASLENPAVTGGTRAEADTPDLDHDSEEESPVLMPPGEQAQIVNLVINESRELLTDVKEGLNTFAVDSGAFEAIEEVPAKLAQIKGALAVLNYQRAAELLGAAIEYVRNDVLRQQQAPDAVKLDALADIITSIEYYLEAIEDSRAHPETILAVAELSVEELGYPLASPAEADGAAPGKSDADGGTRAAVLDLDAQFDVGFDEPVAAVEEEPSASEAEAGAETPAHEQASPSPEPEPKLEAEAEAAANEASLASLEEDEFAADIEADIDEEILEIFLEEADEVLGTMTDCLHAWRADPEDHKSLETLRRSYHTLKGSGRLAGAMVTGEYAWAFENMLNRVLEGKLEPSPALFQLLTLSEPALHGLLAHLKGETERRPPVKRLMALADTLAEGGELSLSDLPGTAVEAAAEAATIGEAPVGTEDIAESETTADETAAEPVIEPLEPSVPAEASTGEEPAAESATAIEGITFETASPAGEEFTHDAEPATDQEPVVAEAPQTEEPLTEAGEPFPGDTPSLDEEVPATEEPPADTEAGDEAAARGDDTPITKDREADTAPAGEEPAFDPVLADIFRKETEGHLEALREFITDHSAVGPFPVTEGLHRALHTLHGSARMAGVSSIAALSEPMDRFVRTLLERDIPFDHAGLAALEEFTDRLAEALSTFDQSPPSQRDNTELLARIAAMHEQALALPPAEASTETVEAAAAPAMAQDGEDQELLEIFLDEASEILTTSDELLQRWPANLHDTGLLHELQRALHTLKGSARLANIPPIGDLTHEMEALLEGITEGHREADADLPALIQHCLDWLQQAVEQVRRGEALSAADDCLAQLAEWKAETAAAEAQHEAAEPVHEPAEKQDEETAAETDQPEAAPAEPQEEERIELAPMFDEQPDRETGDADYDTELLEIFLEEAEEIQESVESILDQWSQDHENLDHVAELQRALHTLKGGARMANVTAVGDLAHVVESLLERMAEGLIAPEARFPALLQDCHDWLSEGLELARQRHTVPAATSLVAQIEAAIRGETAPAAEAEPTPATGEPPAATEEETTRGEASLVSDELEEIDALVLQDTASTDKTQAAPLATEEQVRVRADLLNDLVNFSGEINIYSARIGQQLSAWRFNLAELGQTVSRLREQLRKFEIETETQIMYRHDTGGGGHAEDFDPLELDRFSTMQQLSRGMVESLGDLTSIQGLLEELSSDTDTLLLQQQRVTSELQEGLMHTRMVAFSSILPRLRRIVRQTAAETDKQVKLTVNGAEGELDRSQLNRLVPALEHILRNAVDHGIEPAAEREAAGKPATGSIRIDLDHQGSEVVLKVSDDGRGLDITALREKAIEKGRLLPDADLSDRELMTFILESGFSTAKEVTQISGRGVGMDVVNTEIKQLGGTLHIDTEQGQGTSFLIRLPLTVLVNQALMVQVGEATYAIQLPNVEHVIRVGHDELAPLVAGTESHYDYAGNRYQYLSLGKVLSGVSPVLPGGKQRIPLLLLRSGDHRVALQVDTLLGRQEIVIKSVGPQLSSVNVLSGATILPDGEVALILDVGNLVRSVMAQQHGVAEPLLPAAEAVPAQAEEHRLTVMVVDDSITVRKVTERLLSRYDFDVITAKDGVDALTVMLEQVPDIMLLDVEMPRMDGYELATTMRNDERLREVPIIMITSRTGEKHRQRAMDIGVDEYMGKPYQEAELIDNIRNLVGATA